MVLIHPSTKWAVWKGMAIHPTVWKGMASNGVEGDGKTSNGAEGDGNTSNGLEGDVDTSKFLESGLSAVGMGNNCKGNDNGNFRGGGGGTSHFQPKGKSLHG